jgi:predicted Zn finger-like uncharacterized protein
MAFAVPCPECGSSLEVDDDHRDWTVRCPHCRHEFRPSAAAATLAVVEHNDEEPEERPRRKRRRRRRHEYGDPDKGREAIAKPALALEVMAWLSLLLIVGLSIFLVVVGFAMEDQPQAQKQDDPPELFIYMGFCLGIFSVPYFAVIAFGARKLRNLSSQTWGITAAVMSVASIVLFGVCGLPIIATGIWAIVALNNDDVKAAFREQNDKGDDYDDDY